MIKIYSSETCNNCKLIAQYLTTHGVEIDKIIITDEIAEDLSDKGFSRLPVLEVEGRLIGNTDKDTLDTIIAGEKTMYEGK